MRHFWILFLCLGLGSCELFVSKDKKTEELVNQELRNMDWDNVDQYPLFADCDEMASKDIQRECFEETLLLHLSATLQESGFILREAIQDTLFLDFIIENNGTVFVINIHNKELLGVQRGDFEEYITQSLESLPRIGPALKRGIPVKAKFRIPIVLNSK